MGLPGGWELFLVLIIVLLVFGVGRVGKIGGELGQAVSNFRRGLQDGAKPEEAPKTEQKDTV
jgi:sec-independent protein translocase protein TatA